MPPPFDQFDDIRDRRQARRCEPHRDCRFEPAIDGMLRTWVLRERCFHARKRIRLPAPQPYIARGTPIEGRGGDWRKCLFIQRQQFRFTVDAVRIDVFAEFVECGRGRGRRRLEKRNAARTKPQQMRGFRVTSAPGKDRQRVTQCVDQSSRGADIGPGIAVRCVQLRFRHAVQIAAIQREMLACEAAWSAQTRAIRDGVRRAVCQTVYGSCGVGPHLSFLFNHLGQGYQPASNLTTKIATSDKSNYQH
ncbi:hypothetical protein [Burkholderia sp. THE68]|uniref:hypothetical protein n=1 Tax=Burkholderia sp. THE68 TaxID=758782 RepID=UPI001E4D1596|nr:hypothetical protein [Burkholderia sp. THE68]